MSSKQQQCSSMPLLVHTARQRPPISDDDVDNYFLQSSSRSSTSSDHSSWYENDEQQTMPAHRCYDKTPRQHFYYDSHDEHIVIDIDDRSDFNAEPQTQHQPGTVEYFKDLYYFNDDDDDDCEENIFIENKDRRKLSPGLFPIEQGDQLTGNEFATAVAKEYLALFNFAGLRIDAALRRFLSHFCLLGETQERERVMIHFSERYNQCNPALFANVDVVHTLACALLLLNNDQHGELVGKRMTCKDFIDNLAHTGQEYKRDLLKQLYNSIRQQPIEFASSDSPTSSSQASTSRVTQSATLPRSGTLMHQSQKEVDDSPESQVEYKNGWVMRKSVRLEQGKRTPFGRRGWKMFYATLRGLVLFLHKDDTGFKKSQYLTYRNGIRIHHAYAFKPNPKHVHSKRQHLFVLMTADLSEYIFQTSDPKQVDEWVDALNFVAASFSSPPLPAPVSSNVDRINFYKPVLPATPCKLSAEIQLSEHRTRVQEITARLAELRVDAPPRTAKGRAVQEYFYRERYLEEERERYAAYVNLLTSRLRSSQTEPSRAPEKPPYPAQLLGNGHVVNGEGSYESNDYRESSTSTDRRSYREALEDYDNSRIAGAHQQNSAFLRI